MIILLYTFMQVTYNIYAELVRNVCAFQTFVFMTSEWVCN